MRVQVTYWMLRGLMGMKIRWMCPEDKKKVTIRLEQVYYINA